MTARVNYVIPLWDGDRHQGMDYIFAADRSVYLKTHIWQLSTLRHNLAQITFVRCAQSPDDPKLRATLARLPRQIGTARVQVLSTTREGWSYGAFAEAFEKDRSGFDFYLFGEDDYAVVMDNFDRFLVRFMTANPFCGYACTLAASGNEQGALFGSIPHGILSAKALTDNRTTHGGSIPHNTQVEFGVAFAKTCWKVMGLSPLVRSPYWAGHCTPPGERDWNGMVSALGKTGGVDLFVPVQMLWHPQLSPWPVRWASPPLKAIMDDDLFWYGLGM